VQVYLNEEEVLAIENVILEKPKHKLTRDLFLFQCSTGLAYTDLVNMNHEDISIDGLGRKWIVKQRQKSGITSTIPLLPKAVELIEKYNPDKKRNGNLFPHYSIQKYNEYIAEIGVAAGITKRLSSHVARRTFGNIALTRGISLNVISKILGHSNTLITQRIYAITTQNIITKEIEKW
jgi:integrase